LRNRDFHDDNAIIAIMARLIRLLEPEKRRKKRKRRNNEGEKGAMRVDLQSIQIPALFGIEIYPTPP